MLSAHTTPLQKILFILNESKNYGQVRLTAIQISEYALTRYEEDLPPRVIINTINRVPSGLIMKHHQKKKIEYEILAPGKKLLLIHKDHEKTGMDLLYERNIHPRIIEVSGQLFANGHYPQAIFEAFKEINTQVKAKSGLANKDGTDLMAHAFRFESPKLKLTPLQSESEKDEQKGFMYLFMGAMLGIRNPKAHDRIIQTDPVKTLEYIAFASLLLRRVEESEVSL